MSRLRFFPQSLFPARIGRRMVWWLHVRLKIDINHGGKGLLSILLFPYTTPNNRLLCMTGTAQTLRTDNRRDALVDAAAAAFRELGYHAASMREVAGRVGMLAGSVYYHFASKDELLIAVYTEGVRRISDQVREEITGHTDPRARLQSALEAHLDALLDGSDYVQVVIRVLPKDAPKIEDRLNALRDDYEDLFRQLIEDLNMSPEKKRYLRLFLFGACNWTQVWYRKGGESPRLIARHLMACVEGAL